MALLPYRYHCSAKARKPPGPVRPVRAFPTLSGERAHRKREPKDGPGDDVGLSLRLCGHVDSRVVAVKRHDPAFCRLRDVRPATAPD
jgi:hypothetical protein